MGRLRDHPDAPAKRKKLTNPLTAHHTRREAASLPTSGRASFVRLSRRSHPATHAPSLTSISNAAARSALV
jgi:hypothetical protein